MNNLRETDVQDSEGRVVISPGLKVRHKDSQYEYTVDSVVAGEDGDNTVVLKLPEEPRFEPSTASDTLMSDPSPQRKSVIYEYEVDPDVVLYEPDSSDDNDDPEAGIDFLAVPQKEFEKDYEVN